MKSVKYSAKEKYNALTMWLNNKEDILKVSKKFKCSERTLWRWKAKYDGTLDSLQNGSTVPHTPSPKAHTQTEIENIKKVFDANHDISYAEAYGVLRAKFAYSRTYFGFWRFVSKNGIRHSKEVVQKYIEQPYNTPEMLAIKMQMDVKVVPKSCVKGRI